jgi:alkyl hydroperoxide reductase subunit AhpF
LRGLLKYVTSLSARITLKTDATDARKSSFALNPIGESPPIRFAAFPMGNRFTSLVLALLQVGDHPPKIEAELIEQIKDLEGAGSDGELRLEPYVSPTCHSCTNVVQALNLTAVLNPRVLSVAIDGGLYQNEVTERQILAVPIVFLSGALLGQGRMEVDEIVANLDTGAAAHDVVMLNAKDPYDVLIVGGGPAGAAAALYAACKGIRAGVLAEHLRGQTMDTMSIDKLHRGARDRRAEVRRVFVQIDLMPNSEWLWGTLELSRHAEIVVDACSPTLQPGAFAAGDVTTAPLKQIIIATGNGAKAALGALDHLIHRSAPEPVDA